MNNDLNNLASAQLNCMSGCFSLIGLIFWFVVMIFLFSMCNAIIKTP